jgi:hypothetical protein
VDSNGVEVEKENSMGMQMQTKLLCPDMCVVMDKVGCNINMTKDGHVNGTQFIVDKNDEAKQKASKKEKTLYVFGLNFIEWNITYVCCHC